MPAPARTSKDAIVAAARAILEEDGLDAVVMSRVAERVGVRGPSLYKHVRDRAALVRAVADGVTDDLASGSRSAVSTGDPRRGPHGSGTRLSRLRPRQPERLRTAVRPPRPGAPAGPGASRRPGARRYRGDGDACRGGPGAVRPRGRSWRGRTGSSRWSLPVRSGSAASWTRPTRKGSRCSGGRSSSSSRGSAGGRAQHQGHDEQDEEDAHDEQERPDVAWLCGLHVRFPRTARTGSRPVHRQHRRPAGRRVSRGRRGSDVIGRPVRRPSGDGPVGERRPDRSARRADQDDREDRGADEVAGAGRACRVGLLRDRSIGAGSRRRTGSSPISCHRAGRS